MKTNKKPNLIKRIETAWLAKEVKKEMTNFHLCVREYADENNIDVNEMLDFPQWPYVLQTTDGEYVVTMEKDSKEQMLCLFIDRDEAEQINAMFFAHTGKEAKVVQPEHNFPFKKDVLLTIKNCGFHMWYGTYRSIYHLQVFKSMEATGLL
jgi:hypothetical protein